MAFIKTLDLYKDLILPRLADGPKSQLQLEVPRYALELSNAMGWSTFDEHGQADNGLPGRADVV